MRHVFIVNPSSGKVNAEESIRTAIAQAGIENAEIYLTKCGGDATRYIRDELGEQSKDEKIRVYACGGDGTINEAVNGAVGFENISVYPYPVGSGNDFVKYYGDAAKFLDLKNAETAVDVKADLMKTDAGYAVNVINFGFDTDVCRTMINVKKKAIIGGKRAYTTGVVHALFTAMKNKCTVWVDGEKLNESGKMLLCTVACGHYVGGQFKCAPRSDNTDGLLDVCLVDPISRFKFVKLLPVYTEGGHLDDPRFADIMHYRRGKHVKIEAEEGFAYCLDGEIIECREFEIDVVEGGVNITVPKKLVK